MKKKILKASILGLTTAFTLMACSADMCDVTFFDGSKILKQEEVKKGSKVESFTPKKDGYTFDGWYNNDKLLTKFDFNLAIESDTSIYAKFLENDSEIPDENAQFPVTLAKDGKSFTYGFEGDEKTVSISEQAIYLDGRLSADEIKDFSNVYNDFNQALEAAKSGSKESTTKIYIVPYVYWIHDPKQSSTEDAFGIIKEIEYLTLEGLTTNPSNVVIAGNFGHDEGYAGGNWTMFKIIGDGLTLENITFGNYCNVDLVYNLDSSLNVEKRTTNITQGQIGLYEGDKLLAKNCNFISRLNMMPFNNNERALYIDCHMESTDDALNGSSKAVYLNCDLDFYGSKPWYSSSGSTLLNCDMNIKPINYTEDYHQYLSKAVSNFNLVDCRFKSEYDVTVGYNDILPQTFRNFYSNITLNGKAIKMDNGVTDSEVGVDITGTEALKAFKLENNGSVIYNVYNLLRGNDNWDPLNQQEVVESLNAQDLPIRLDAFIETDTGNVSTIEIETGNKEAVLGFTITGLNGSNYLAGVKATWQVLGKEAEFLEIEVASDGLSAMVRGNNNTEENKTIYVEVSTDTGFKDVVEIVVKPSILDAPTFTQNPVLMQNEDGTISIHYELNLDGREDLSDIKWYVANDNTFKNEIEVAVSYNTPLKEIAAVKAYVDKYVKAVIRPKHNRSEYGEAVSVILNMLVKDLNALDVTSMHLDFKNFSTKVQKEIKKGFFTIDGYKPLDTYDGEAWYSKNKVVSDELWSYGTGNKNGFLNYSGLYQTGYGARLMYTPFKDTAADMALELKVAPGKTVGQGFGSANQYMDVMIKYDTMTLTGYGVRIYRNTGDSCGVVLMKYTNGMSAEISERVITSAYLTEATIKIACVNNKLIASLTTTAPNPGNNQEYSHEVYLEVEIESNNYGGFAIQHAGTAGDNATYIGMLNCKWN